MHNKKKLFKNYFYFGKFHLQKRFCALHFIWHFCDGIFTTYRSRRIQTILMYTDRSILTKLIIYFVLNIFNKHIVPLVQSHTTS